MVTVSPGFGVLSTAASEVPEHVPRPGCVFARCELAGDEVGDADGGERRDLLTYGGLVTDE